MKPLDDLFQLIKSLTKSEKRYFKLINSKKSGEKNNYIRLFDAIDKQKDYNEEKIKKQFSGTAFIKYLPSEKQYLYNLILKSLDLFYAHSTEEKHLEELMHYTEILFIKGLYQQSKKVADKAMKMALADEMYPQVIKLFQHQIKLINQVSVSLDEMKIGFAEAHAGSELAIKNLINLGNFYDLYSQMYYLMKKDGEIIRKDSELKEFEKILKAPLMENEAQALSFKSKQLYYFIKSIYYFVKNDFENAYIVHKKLLDMYGSYPGKEQQFVDSAQLSNMCELCIRMKNYKEFWQYHNRLKELPARTMLEKSRKFYRVNDLLLWMYTQTGKFDEGVDLINTFQSEFKVYEHHVNKPRMIGFYYHIAYSYFGAGDFKNSLVWVNKILNDSKADLRRDFLCFARILNLIIHFELKNNVLLEHIIKSTHHFLFKRERLYKIEAILLKFLKRISIISDNVQVMDLFKGLHNELSHLLKDPYEKTAFEYFDLISWVKSKIQEKDFGEMSRSKVVNE